jgi:hypothetical protein
MYIKTLMAAAVLSVLAVSGARAELVTQSLPKPDMVGGKTLMQSLQERKSVREFGRRAVYDQTRRHNYQCIHPAGWHEQENRRAVS